MSTLMHDLPSHTAFALALSPRVLSEDDTGPAVELPDGDGPVFAAVQVGGLDPGTVVSVTFEQSSGNGVWSPVPAAVPAVSAANAVAAAAFPRPARFLRGRVSLAGPSPLAEVAVLVGQQKKVM